MTPTIHPENIMNATLANLDAFTTAYIDAMFFTEEETLKEDAAQHESEYEPATRWDVNIHCLAPETLDRIIADCDGFQATYAALLDQAREWRDDYDYTQAGHDFWLTRNRHGAGFWDRGLGPIGEQLRLASHSEGNADLYFGDDGKLYIA